MDFWVIVGAVLATVAAVYGLGDGFKALGEVRKRRAASGVGEVGKILGIVVALVLLLGGSALFAIGTFVLTATAEGTETHGLGIGWAIIGLIVYLVGLGLVKLMAR